MTQADHKGSSAPGSDGSANGRVAGLRAEAERAKGTVKEVRTEIATAAEARRGGPATSVEDATSKAADLRLSIERDLAALKAKVPDTDEVATRARTIGAAAGGALVGLVGLVAVARRRSARKEHDERIREQAVALAQEIQRLERGEDEDASGGALRWLALGAAVAAAAGVAWQRSRSAMGVEDVFGAEPDPLRPSDVTSSAPSAGTDASTPGGTPPATA
jgi:hypothetical protein